MNHLLNDALADRGWSRTEFARRLTVYLQTVDGDGAQSVARSTVSRWISRARVPTFRQLVAMKAVAGVRRDEEIGYRVRFLPKVVDWEKSPHNCDTNVIPSEAHG
jgi:hypothetical protein